VGVSCVDSGENTACFGAAHRCNFDRGESVTALAMASFRPGIPPDFPNPKSLLTIDCIRPTE
jgi:hypothetical protein